MLSLSTAERAALETQNRGVMSLRLEPAMERQLWALGVLEQKLGGNILTALGRKILQRR